MRADRWAARRRNIRRGAVGFRSSRAGMTGLVLLILFGLMAVIHPLLLDTVWPPTVYDPERGYDRVVVEKTAVVEVTDPDTEVDLMRARLLDPFINEGDLAEVAQPGRISLKHPLGTDTLGRDVLSMIRDCPAFCVRGD